MTKKNQNIASTTETEDRSLTSEIAVTAAHDSGKSTAARAPANPAIVAWAIIRRSTSCEAHMQWDATASLFGQNQVKTPK